MCGVAGQNEFFHEAPMLLFSVALHTGYLLYDVLWNIRAKQGQRSEDGWGKPR
ncbi:MAG: hypothetical protein ACRESZ_13830 [Methylococcales bacterium]